MPVRKLLHLITALSILTSTPFALIWTVNHRSLYHWQGSAGAYPAGFEQLCPTGSQPIAQGNTWNPSTQRWKANQCIDANGNLSSITSGAASFSQINNRVFADLQSGIDACSKILTAYSLLPTTGGQNFADGFQGVQNCSANPFPTSSKSGTLWLGNTIFKTTASWILKNKMNMYGVGRGDAANNTYIQAQAGFPTSTPIIQFETTNPTFDIIIGRLGVDCNNISGAIGVQDIQSQEQSSVREVDIVNCPGTGLDISGGAQNSGPFEKIEVLMQGTCTNCNGSTIGINAHLSGVPFRGIHAATINATGVGGSAPNVGINAATPGTYEDIHCENVVSCITIAANDVIVKNIQCAATVTTCVTINGGSQNAQLFGIFGSSTNLVVDNMNAITLTSAGEAGGSVGWYQTGSSGAGPGQCSSSINTGCSSLFKNQRGSCTMAAGTTCTFTINRNFPSSLCFVTIDAGSTPPATAISAKCSLAATTVTITAGTSNSLTWDAFLVAQ